MTKSELRKQAFVIKCLQLVYPSGVGKEQYGAILLALPHIAALYVMHCGDFTSRNRSGITIMKCGGCGYVLDNRNSVGICPGCNESLKPTE